MVISVADASTWLSICYQWVIENIYFIAFLTLYPQECSILPILPADLKQTPKNQAALLILIILYHQHLHFFSLNTEPDIHSPFKLIASHG